MKVRLHYSNGSTKEVHVHTFMYNGCNFDAQSTELFKNGSTEYDIHEMGVCNISTIEED